MRHIVRELSYKYVARLSLKSLYKLAIDADRPNAVASIETALDCERRGEAAAARQWASIACFQLCSRQVA